MRVAVWIATLSVAFSSAAMPNGPAPGKNLVANGGFEKSLEGWEVRGQTDTLKANHDTKERKEGRASAHLAKTGGFAADYFAGTARDLPAGGKVRVAAEVKGKDLANAWVKVYFLSKAGEPLNEDVDLRMLRGTFAWQTVEAEFTVPDGADRVEVRFYFFLGGEAWLDEVVVEALGGAKAVPKKAAKPLDATTRRWLEENAVAVETLDLEAQHADLAPLKALLKDVRIVQLGENTHGDGACFDAKARLVRFLHEECGFEVLAFESGLFECERANERLRAGKGAEALDESVFGIWRVSQVRPLFAYLAERAAGQRPLHLSGFDCRASGSGAAELWPTFRRVLTKESGARDEDFDAVLRLETAMGGGDAYEPKAEDVAAGLAAWSRLRALFDEQRAAIEARHGTEEAAFLSRCLDNWKAREEVERSKADKSLGKHGVINLRDAAMAENLLWLAEVRHPGRKIIAWGATFHFARGLEGVRMAGDPKYYAGCRNMGQIVHEALGDACYTIGFAAAGGRAGSFAWQSELDPPRDGSIEDTLQRFGAPYLFVDLRRGGPFQKPLRLAPMSYGRDILAAWPKVLDGIFFIETMTPAR